jgi:hypothetical protein
MLAKAGAIFYRLFEKRTYVRIANTSGEELKNGRQSA